MNPYKSAMPKPVKGTPKKKTGKPRIGDILNRIGRMR